MPVRTYGRRCRFVPPRSRPDKDPQFQAKLKDPEQYNFIYGSSATTLDKEIPQSAKNAVFIFLGALAVIVSFAIFQNVLPSVYGYFFIPNYPSDIATVNFDRSGTTVIGKYLLNHSFMMPGLICVSVSTLVAYLISMLIY